MTIGQATPVTTYIERSTLQPGECTAELQPIIESVAKSGGEVVLGPGEYQANLNIRGVRGFCLRGTSRNKTVIVGHNGTPALSIAGYWYSRIQDIGFGTGPQIVDRGVLDIDSSQAPYDAQGIQANTFDNISVNGRGLYDGQRSRFAMTMCRTGENSAQGSEQCFQNCHFSGASQACYYQVGYNALNNQFIGGNFQDYSRHGIQLIFGSLHVYGVGFQSTAGFEQIVNDGWDIVADSGGVADSLSIDACRTESLRFFKGNGAQPPMITNCNQRSALPQWWAGSSYEKGAAIERNGEVWKCATSHIAGTTFDSSLWTLVVYHVVDIYQGIIDNCNWQVGKVLQRANARDMGVEVNDNYTVQPGIKWVAVSAASRNVVITLRNPQELPAGDETQVIRTDNNPMYTVTVQSGYFNNQNVHTDTLTGAPSRFHPHGRRVGIYKALGGHHVARRHYIVG